MDELDGQPLGECPDIGTAQRIGRKIDILYGTISRMLLWDAFFRDEKSQ